MQNRYAGDLGDFLKLALLRLLAVGDARPLGLVWCLAPDQQHNLDGKHISYLEPASARGKRFRVLDPEVYDGLAAMLAAGERSVRRLEEFGALPQGLVSFAAPIGSIDSTQQSPSERLMSRQQWLRRALDATAGCGVVFFDPDNGIRSATHAAPMHRVSAVKHIYTSELAPFVARGQSVVVYHHADRSGKVPKQAQSRLQTLEDEAGGEAVCAVYGRLGSPRLFLVLAAPHDVRRLTQRMQALEASAWSGHMDVLWRER